MDTKDLASNKSSYRHSVEYIDKSLPHLGIGASFAFIVESINYSKEKEREHGKSPH
jgi:FMN-dependent NADH-azoreductase